MRTSVGSAHLAEVFDTAQERDPIRAGRAWSRGSGACACVVPSEGAILRGEDLTAFARRQLADYRVPDLVSVFDAMPLTASGKVKRRELAQVVALDHPAT